MLWTDHIGVEVADDQHQFRGRIDRADMHLGNKQDANNDGINIPQFLRGWHGQRLREHNRGKEKERRLYQQLL